MFCKTLCHTCEVTYLPNVFFLKRINSRYDKIGNKCHAPVQNFKFLILSYVFCSGTFSRLSVEIGVRT